MTNNDDDCPADDRSPLGIIAGNGSFPLEVASKARCRGIEVHAIALIGETDPRLEALVDSCTWVHMGKVGEVLRLLKRKNIRRVTFIGGIRRSGLWRRMRLDWRAFLLLARLASRRDDGLLRGVSRYLEGHGLTICSPDSIMPELLSPAGQLSRRALTKQEREDARLGWQVMKTLGDLDIGQAITVHAGAVIAIEAIEGTDKMLQRTGELCGSGGVLVKISKSAQDKRFDLPSIGPKTVETMHQAHVRALVIEAHHTLMLNFSQIVSECNLHGIALVSVTDLSEL